MTVNRASQRPTQQDGLTLLITLLLMGVLLGVSTSLLNITLKQYQLSGTALASEAAFQAANAGMECALYYDLPQSGTSPFSVPGTGDEQASAPAMSCMGVAAVTADDYSNLPGYTDPNVDNGRAVSGGEQRFQFTWGTPEVCSEVSIYKFTEDPDFDSGNTDGPEVNINGQPIRDTEDEENNRCPEGSVCTVIQARGYNVACGLISSGVRVVEREYTQVY